MQMRTNDPMKESLLTWHQVDHRAWEACYGRITLRIEQTGEGDRWRFSVRHPEFGRKEGYASDAGRAMAMATDEGIRALEAMAGVAVDL